MIIRGGGLGRLLREPGSSWDRLPGLPIARAGRPALPQALKAAPPTTAVPVRDQVKVACEILGMDPLFVANKGKLVALVAESSADAVLQAMRTIPQGRAACRIGRVVSQHPGMVVLKTEVGGSRIIDVPFAEQLPRIC